MANILIIDDDDMLCEMLAHAIGRMGHDVKCAHTLKDGLHEVTADTFDLVFLDVGMPDGDGLSVLPRIQEAPYSPEVIIITGSGDPDGAELAIKCGVWDYIEKTDSIQAITLPLIRALQYREEKQAQKPSVALTRDGIIGSSQKMKRSLDLLAQAANSDANVLLVGETGTGKELFARAIHENSARANKTLVVVDCTALPGTLVESILFGHTKGAFTGASEAKDGLITQAHGGTLFLDEIGELPLSIQKAFLRVLQERRFRPIGSQREVVSNFRLVAATNRNLDKLAKKGQFREDLLFRIQSITIDLPPLRERREDIIGTAMYHATKISERYGTGMRGFSPEFTAALTTYDWPGNVRELINTLEKVLADARHESTLFPKHLPSNIRIQLARDSVGKDPPKHSNHDQREQSPETLSLLNDVREAAISQAEKHYLDELMIQTGDDIEEACKVAGLRRARLYELLKKYSISRPR